MRQRDGVLLKKIVDTLRGMCRKRDCDQNITYKK